MNEDSIICKIPRNPEMPTFRLISAKNYFYKYLFKQTSIIITEYDNRIHMSIPLISSLVDPDSSYRNIYIVGPDRPWGHFLEHFLLYLHI